MRFDEYIFDILKLEGRRMHGGLYALEHRPSRTRLISYTTCIAKRVYDQLKALQDGEHFNSGVQADLERDGYQAFRIVLLAVADDPQRLRQLKEQHIRDWTSCGRPVYNHTKSRSSTAIEVETGKDDGQHRDQDLNNVLDRLRRFTA